MEKKAQEPLAKLVLVNGVIQALLLERGGKKFFLIGEYHKDAVHEVCNEAMSALNWFKHMVDVSVEPVYFYTEEFTEGLEQDNPEIWTPDRKGAARTEFKNFLRDCLLYKKNCPTNVAKAEGIDIRPVEAGSAMLTLKDIQKALTVYKSSLPVLRKKIQQLLDRIDNPSDKKDLEAYADAIETRLESRAALAETDASKIDLLGTELIDVYTTAKLLQPEVKHAIVTLGARHIWHLRDILCKTLTQPFILSFYSYKAEKESLKYHTMIPFCTWLPDSWRLTEETKEAVQLYEYNTPYYILLKESPPKYLGVEKSQLKWFDYAKRPWLSPTRDAIAAPRGQMFCMPPESSNPTISKDQSQNKFAWQCLDTNQLDAQKLNVYNFKPYSPFQRFLVSQDGGLSPIDAKSKTLTSKLLFEPITGMSKTEIAVVPQIELAAAWKKLDSGNQLVLKTEKGYFGEYQESKFWDPVWTLEDPKKKPWRSYRRAPVNINNEIVETFQICEDEASARCLDVYAADDPRLKVWQPRPNFSQLWRRKDNILTPLLHPTKT